MGRTGEREGRVEAEAVAREAAEAKCPQEGEAEAGQAEALALPEPIPSAGTEYAAPTATPPEECPTSPPADPRAHRAGRSEARRRECHPCRRPRSE